MGLERAAASLPGQQLQSLQLRGSERSRSRSIAGLLYLGEVKASFALLLSLTYLKGEGSHQWTAVPAFLFIN